jgi:maltooligosyltrehalose trehalohydrolase
MADGTILMLALNLADAPVPVVYDRLADGQGGTLLFSTEGLEEAVTRNELPPRAFLAVLEPKA